MFPTDVVSGIGQGDATYKLLKPWWDVMTDYLALAMLMISFVAGTMQITKGDIVCVPVVDCQSGNNYMNTAAKNICSTYEANYTEIKPIRTMTLADRRQYDFVGAECGVKAVHSFQSYFPFIIFLEVLVLIVIKNVWLKYPKTASVVESFTGLVLECHNAEGTLPDFLKAIEGSRSRTRQGSANADSVVASVAIMRLLPQSRQDSSNEDGVNSSETIGGTILQTRQDSSNEDSVNSPETIGGTILQTRQGSSRVYEDDLELKQEIFDGDSLQSDSNRLPRENQATRDGDGSDNLDTRFLGATQAAQTQENASAQHTHRVTTEAEVHINILQDEDQSTTEADTVDLSRSLKVNQRITCLNCI